MNQIWDAIPDNRCGDYEKGRLKCLLVRMWVYMLGGVAVGSLVSFL